ncbi:Ribulose-1,5 bisphosphate carboxylase/oxygenase large subunit N-methyltransferase, chloroplastic [Apostasia shenzhenica]|uniref:Ribulose-1,5 bisphosphate carboxylase/oxygenase large subunit N-methyltransferase, chloroplastic n=1 Tax=Apostasia shenzhenica TaxID=1088818 RepID=A0A2H9ZZG5_9ASPA|nr:Ribulose-1,5 bisphosphate carboxylase/oxygenase large subunit N-methyltransferase, chloroplastic [Apostasia shenzhenica]
MWQTQRDGVLYLRLPSLDEVDPLFSEKKRLLHARNLHLIFELLLPSPSGALLEMLDQIVYAARILYLNEVEIYFIEDDDFGPFSPRNELQSLNSLLAMLVPLLSNAKPEELEALHELQKETISMINKFSDQNIDEVIIEEFDTTVEELLLKWGESHGAKSKVKIAYFDGVGRGAVAAEDIEIGESVLEIPETIIISEDLIRESDIFDVLNEWDGMTTDSMLLLWSMRERYNPASKFKNYFATLPDTFNTGLSFGVDSLAVLQGTLVLEELLQAKEHLWKQYESLCLALCAWYPNIFPPELYSWDKYLWACELWYSNSMKVVCTDGKLRTCLVPIAGFLNHSLCPHVINYGRVDAETKSLKLRLARKCKRGEQCYLSYGSLPGSHLVTFYGFIPKGDNPYDVIPLDFEATESDDNQCLVIETPITNHMLRGTWFSRSNKPHTFGLPPRLLTHLRSILKNSDMEHPEDANKDNERAVLETINSIFESMKEGIGDIDNSNNCEDLSWDVKLALRYKGIQLKILSSVLSSCATGLKALGSNP